MVQVVDAVLDVPGTFSADEIATNLRNRVSRATVFRTIGSLAEADLIRQVRLNGQSVFVLTANELE
jgi:Fe2+ or Zn2+ uptake regulation protein